jgi:hypothetical protein
MRALARRVVPRVYHSPSARFSALGGALRAWWSIRLVAAYVVGFVVAGLVVVVLGWSWLLCAALFVPVALAAEWLFLGRRLRAAEEAFAWIGRWEWLRAREALGGSLPRTRKGLIALSEREHEAHPLWVELYAAVGRYDDALSEAESLATRSAWERFERELVVAYVHWVTSGALDDGAARTTASELSDEEERLRADAMLTVNEARARLVEGEDWLELLAELRHRIGPRARGVLRHDWWPTRLREAGLVAGGIAVVTLAADWVVG